MLFRPKADVQVELASNRALPGETVRATVRVTPRRDLDLQEGRVELVFENEYTYREHADSSSWRSTRTRKATDRRVVEEQRFLAAGALTADVPLEHEVELTIPVDAAPSAEGKITKVRWKVVATLARPHARDVHGEARVEVLSPAASDALAAPDVDAHGDCRLSFELRRSDFGPGDAVEGTLVANPLRECRLDEVRVELRRDEKVPRKKGNEARVREAEVKLDAEVELSTLVPREWPFRLELPADLVPCLETEESRVTWSLKGVASRRLRFDERVTLPIDVHTAPSRES